jgi:hypothetical protein
MTNERCVARAGMARKWNDRDLFGSKEDDKLLDDIEQSSLRALHNVS